MSFKKTAAGIAAAGALATGGTVVADQQINPYKDQGAVLEITAESVIEAAGENKIELAKDRPAVTFSKWNGEAAMTVSYEKVQAEGDRAFFTDRMEWKGEKEEVHAYPLPAGDGMEDGGFEIEVVLSEKPDTNRFDFRIEGAEELDFFYQPALSPQEIEDGGFRPENVVGSYAVYHKEKGNHQVGDTNYGTGKAFHIYRPKAIDADGLETWAELAYADGLLSVTVSQEWLNTAAYPVRVDPTFGHTSIGASSEFNLPDANTIASANGGYDAPENGTITTVSLAGTSNNNARPVVYDPDNSDALVTYGAQVALTSGSFKDMPVTLASILSGNTYRFGWWTGTNNTGYRYDATAGFGYHTDTGVTYSFTDPPPGTYGIDGSVGTRRISIYATYTVAAAAGIAPWQFSDF